MSEHRSEAPLPRFGTRRRGRARGRREPLAALPPRHATPREPVPMAPWFPRRRRDETMLPWDVALSLLAHALVIALLVLELWPRDGGESPLSPPAVEIVFESGQPEPRATGAPEGEAPTAEPEARAEAPPPAPDDSPATQQPPPQAPPSPPQPPAPPQQQAMPLPPTPPALPPPPTPAPPQQQAPPPPAPPLAQTPLPPAAPLPPPLPAIAELPPRPVEPVPRLSAEIPATELPPDLLAPPTPLRITPPRVQPAPTPTPTPRPATPRPPQQQAQPSSRLPGMVLPDGFNLSTPRPAPGRPTGPRAPLDLSLDPRHLEGRTTADPVVQVRGANVGPDWSAAFRRWLDQNIRYPPRAVQDGDSGQVRVRILANPDGTVRGVRMLQQSASPALNTGTTMPFAGARLPAFPPGSDPNGIEVDLTVNYVLIRR